MNFLLVDDHSIVRSYLKIILEKIHPNSTCIEANCEQDAIEYINTSIFDLIILDIIMPNSDSFKIINHIKLYMPKSKILILTSYSYDVYVVQLMKMGINGYINKNATNAEIENALYLVLNNEFFISESIKTKLIDIIVKSEFDLNPFNKLNKKEYLVAEKLLKGYKLSEIGNILGLKKTTLNIYKNNLFCKLGIKSNNFIDFVKLGIKHNVISEFE